MAEIPKISASEFHESTIALSDSMAEIRKISEQAAIGHGLSSLASLMDNPMWLGQEDCHD
jgi:hypothetical protein